MALISQVSDVGVAVHTENFRLVLLRHLVVNVVSDLLDRLVLGHIVSATLAKFVVLVVDDVLILEDFKDHKHQNAIKVICDVAAIIDFTSHKFESFPWNIVLLVCFDRFRQEILEHGLGCNEI